MDDLVANQQSSPSELRGRCASVWATSVHGFHHDRSLRQVSGVQAAQHQLHEIVYVGDHPANDIIPAQQAGLRTAHMRRGPWGYLCVDDTTVLDHADWRIDSLDGLTAA